MNRPNFQPIFSEKSEFCEKSSDVPVETFVPNQALNLSELISRFERGQRLNVHNNFAPGSNLMNISDDEALESIKHEDIDSADFAPTDVHDIVDVQQQLEEHNAHKREYVQRMKEKKKAQQAKPAKAQPAAEPTPPPVAE